jgi:hypothetical protein
MEVKLAINPLEGNSYFYADPVRPRIVDATRPVLGVRINPDPTPAPLPTRMLRRGLLGLTPKMEVKLAINTLEGNSYFYADPVRPRIVDATRPVLGVRINPDPTPAPLPTRMLRRGLLGLTPKMEVKLAINPLEGNSYFYADPVRPRIVDATRPVLGVRINPDPTPAPLPTRMLRRANSAVRGSARRRL